MVHGVIEAGSLADLWRSSYRAVSGHLTRLMCSRTLSVFVFGLTLIWLMSAIKLIEFCNLNITLCIIEIKETKKYTNRGSLYVQSAFRVWAPSNVENYPAFRQTMQLPSLLDNFQHSTRLILKSRSYTYIRMLTFVMLLLRRGQTMSLRNWRL
jgi:hypothetical protein